MTNFIHDLKNNFNRKSAIISFVILSALVTSPFAKAETSDKVVDRVVAVYSQNQPVLLSQLKGKVTSKTSETDFKKTIDNYVYDQIKNKLLAVNNIAASRSEIDQQIAYLAQQSGVSVEELLKGIELQGIALAEYRNYIGQQITNQKLTGFAYQQNFELSDRSLIEAEAEKLYQQDKAAGTLASIKVYDLSHILIKANPLISDEQVKIKLNKIRQDIVSGKVSFAQAAKDNSIDLLSAVNGGELGLQPLDVYDPTFASMASTTKLGNISQPFKTQFGWHIVKVNKIESRAATENEYLNLAFDKLNSTDPKEIIENWKKSLIRNASIIYYYK